MPARVVFTPVAAADLAWLRAWLTQPGAGPRAKAMARRIIGAARDLGETHARHPADPYREGCRQLVMDGHVVSYRVRQLSGEAVVFVERIFGPGQERR